jgi:methyl-accepting chemotaxis protein
MSESTRKISPSSSSWRGRFFRKQHSAELDQVIGEIAIGAGELGVELVDVAGNVDAVSERMAAQVGLFGRLRTDANSMRAENREAAEAAASAREGTHEATLHMNESQEVMQTSLGGLQSLVGWVETVGAQLESLGQTVEGVGDIARQVDSIARRTHVLALNASIEAARSGTAGIGFAVIAVSVRQLADQTIEAASHIDETLGRLAAQIRELGAEGGHAREKAGAAHRDAQSIASTIGSVSTAMLHIDRQVAGMAQATALSGEKVENLVDSLAGLVDGVEHSSQELEAARGRVNNLLEQVEHLIGLTAKTGAQTVDTPFVDLAQRTASEIAALFETAVADGRVSLADIFDEDYRPIPGSNPQQFMTRIVGLTDREIPSRLEPLLDFDPRMKYAVVTDRKGFIGTHNLSVSHPQGPDPVWNDAHARNRRFFNGRTALAASRNTEPFLLQTYRRHMSGGTYALMKDVAAPIVVQGRHYGAVRIGFAQSI